MANSQGMAVETVAVEQGARAALPQYRTRSMLSITLRRLARSYSALWGLCMVCGLILIAVLADAQRRGIARALLAHALGSLHRSGSESAWAEVDESNAAAVALFEGVGARCTGGNLELVRL